MNRDSYVYTIVFTFILTAVFGTVLAVTQAYFLPAIQENEARVEQAAILKVLGIVPKSDLIQAFEEHVVPVTVGAQNAYAVHGVDGNPDGYAWPLKGQGLWGTIRGYIGVSADFDRLLGLEFVEQNETPGLGGRIGEAWFKEQFQNVPIVPGEEIVYGSGVDAITGATSSSNAVLNILNQTIAELMTYEEVLAR